jgi:hypothetical protein
MYSMGGFLVLKCESSVFFCLYDVLRSTSGCLFLVGYDVCSLVCQASCLLEVGIASLEACGDP